MNLLSFQSVLSAASAEYYYKSITDHIKCWENIMWKGPVCSLPNIRMVMHFVCDYDMDITDIKNLIICLEKIYKWNYTYGYYIYENKYFRRTTQSFKKYICRLKKVKNSYEQKQIIK